MKTPTQIRFAHTALREIVDNPKSTPAEQRVAYAMTQALTWVLAKGDDNLVELARVQAHLINEERNQ